MLNKILISICVLALCIAIGAVGVVVDCERLKSPPQAPVYPGSTLSRQVLSGIGGGWPIADYYFTSADTPEKIVAFYAEKGSCGEGERVSGSERCHGNAAPFGEYYVLLDLASYASQGMTSYTVEVLWSGCSRPWD